MNSVHPERDNTEPRFLEVTGDILGSDVDAQQPRCPTCGTVMRDIPGGFVCGGCGHVDDRAAELSAVQMPPEFDGPAIQGG